ncbi:phage head closure protein [Aromatoleum evansii]|uniref:Phage head closure protein n=1 Tax=Aromatoleum evansii TaxID=59406 RepID=A0ABZ1AQZ1_AROEV|nr:phage head closure protein [Aromatoleum evansii]WRL48357.1 phage head closure protein [Aromatoleum evansii]
MGLGAGQFDKRVTLQSKSVTRNSIGEEVVSWVDVATVWARVEPIRGREFFAAAQMQDATDHRVTIRYRTGVVREMRVVWGSLTLDIVSVIDVNTRKENLELMCISGVRTAA